MRTFHHDTVTVPLEAASGCGSDAETAHPDFGVLRHRMVAEQLLVPGYEIENPRVLAAMATVPRHEFVPRELRQRAYEDHPLPIGYGQTISQPFIVAFMTERLDPTPGDKILEIGTGCGYQAAVLAELVHHVYSIELVGPLAQRAQLTLKQLGYKNISVRVGDGYNGWPEVAPFDAIILTCAPHEVPRPLVDQLRDGGRMVIPVGQPGDQMLYILQKHAGHLESHAALPVRFVPMVSELA